MKKFYLLVMVASDETVQLGLINDVSYEKWLNEEDGEGVPPDLCALFWSEKTIRIDAWSGVSEYAREHGIDIIDLVGGLQY